MRQNKDWYSLIAMSSKKGVMLVVVKKAEWRRWELSGKWVGKRQVD